MNMKIGDIVKHGESSVGVIYEIMGESWSKYDPPAGSLKVLISDETGKPYKMNSSDGARYFSFTVYNWPDEMERTKVIGHVDPLTLEPYFKERNEDAEADRMKRRIEPHFIGVVRKSGDLYINRQRVGQKCYVYFAGKERD